MMRILPLLLAAILAAFPMMPSPQVCGMRMSGMPMHHPCCAATTSRAPVKRAVIRIHAAPVAAQRVVRVEPRAEALIAARIVDGSSYWQPLATIQLRI
ncbi:MAG TPA: hypothetical protein VG323_01540 [Thermoanaerobaculia bacterium]|nr:hypothetical protein [Thermoanaerobaculia bacterium]